MAAITTVTFDLWQTLLLDRPEVGRERTAARLRGTRAALLRAGLDFGESRIEDAYRECIQSCQQIREGKRDISFRRQVEIFVEAISPGLAEHISETVFQEVSTAYSDCFFDYPVLPHPEAVAVLRGIQGMGLKLGLISNTGMTPGVSFRRFLAQHGMLHYFEALFFSDEVGIAKPSEEIFAKTLQALGATPEQTIHVGDHIFNDVAAARKCGIKTIWVEGFYERPDPTDPATEPDESVKDLGDVLAAVRRLAFGGPK